jgi:hypothetical protein
MQVIIDRSKMMRKNSGVGKKKRPNLYDDTSFREKLRETSTRSKLRFA